MDKLAIDELIEAFSKNDLWDLAGALQKTRVCRSEVRNDVLEKKIRDCLKGADLTAKEVRDIRRHIELENIVSQDYSAYRNAVVFLNTLFAYVGWEGMTCFTKSKDRWREAKKYLIELVNASSEKCSFEVDDVVRMKGNLIKQLREIGYEIPIIRGRFSASNGDAVKFAAFVTQQFNRIGFKGVELILDDLKTKYDQKTNRYLFRIEPTYSRLPELQVPWGYLWNVALAYVSRPCNARPSELLKIYALLKDRAKLFLGVMELQVMSKIEAVYRPPEDCIDELIENIVYEQQIGIDQLSIHEMYDVLSGLVRHSKENRKAKIYLAALKWICGQTSKLKPFVFDAREAKKHLPGEFESREIEEALLELSTPKNELNAGYVIPMDVGKRNYFRRPFVKSGTDYQMWSAQFFAKGFYQVWFQNCCEQKKHIGELFENVVEDLFRARNVDAIHSGKYKIRFEIRQELSTKSEGAECDFVVEGHDVIYLIEMKAKEVTAKAMAGSEVDVLNVMTGSVLHGYTQAFTHEYCLRKDGKLTLSLPDGSIRTVELNGKKVGKLHVSLFDHYGLHDGVVLQHFLRGVLRFNFSTPDVNELVEFKKFQEKFINIARTKIMQEVYPHDPTLSFASFSLPHFLQLLQSVNSTEDFCREIARTSCVTCSTRDWYQEYSWLRGL